MDILSICMIKSWLNILYCRMQNIFHIFQSYNILSYRYVVDNAYINSKFLNKSCKVPKIPHVSMDVEEDLKVPKTYKELLTVHSRWGIVSLILGVGLGNMAAVRLYMSQWWPIPNLIWLTLIANTLSILKMTWSHKYVSEKYCAMDQIKIHFIYVYNLQITAYMLFK